MTVFYAAGLTASEKKKDGNHDAVDNVLDALHHTYRHRSSRPGVHREVMQFFFPYGGGLVNECADIMPKINRRIRFVSDCYKRFKRELYDMVTAPFTVKMRMLKPELS